MDIAHIVLAVLSTLAVGLFFLVAVSKDFASRINQKPKDFGRTKNRLNDTLSVVFGITMSVIFYHGLSFMLFWIPRDNTPTNGVLLILSILLTVGFFNRMAPSNS